MSADTLRVQVRVARNGFSLDVAFEAPPGVTILFGPSGAGKTTTLVAIAGLLRPDAGRVAIGEVAWFDHEQRIDCAVHERRVGFVFQTLALFPHLDAVGNVAYGMPRSLGRGERRARALALLERLRIAHLARRRPATFSGGEAQRVALARAFAIEPRVVLLDEPFSALDRELRDALADDVRAFAASERVPVVHVTHHRREARALGDRLVQIEAGRVVAEGATRALLPDD